jgi:hypothetical protein
MLCLYRCQRDGWCCSPACRWCGAAACCLLLLLLFVMMMMVIVVVVVLVVTRLQPMGS